MHRFSFFKTPAGRAGPDLRGAHLIGADGIPIRGEVRVEGGLVVCESRNQEALGLSLLWRVAGHGFIQLETTRLLARPEPYHLHVELARHRLMRLSVKREEWGLYDYPGMEPIAQLIDQARDRFVDAMSASDEPEKAAAFADESLSLSIRASEEMCRFHASVFLSRRQQAGGFSRPFLGVLLPHALPKPAAAAKLTDVFDFARIPFVWREIQPREQGVNYDAADALVKFCSKQGLAMRGGPLLSFGVSSVPDWMYIWENDYEAIAEFAREHIRRTIQRYSGQITSWQIATGLHADSVFPFTFEQIIDMTRLAATIARQTAPRAQLILELTQPWAEYYARNQRTVPPLLYAEMAVQSGIPFDAFGLQLIFGLDSDGFHFRDILQVSSLIDRLANLGKAIQITAVSVPNAGGTGGSWRETWSDATQADWWVALVETALSKPYVESITAQCLIDGAAALVPGAGVLAESGHAKPVFAKLARLRTNLQEKK
ncbi:MAG: hypothetical protein AMXMBFR47_39960 [Planctomycetota bacterium]